jgi:MFS family permease
VQRPEPQLSGRLDRALAWGLLWAVIGSLTLYLLAPNPWRIQPSRASELRASLRALDHGGPALLGYRPGTRAPYAIGSSDDQGIYAIVPVLSHWLGQSDPIAVLRWLWIAAWAVTQLFSAVVLRALFRSSWAAMLAPPALLVCILFFGFGDIYWVAAWVIVTFMLPLILLARHRPRFLWAALVLIALVAGAATAIRSPAGLPVALAAGAVAVSTGRRLPSRVAVILAVALAYLCPTWIVLPAIREHRDRRVGVDLNAREPTSHPLWHSLYTGLGYTPNRYRIHYLDAYAAAAAQEADPGVRYLSPAYASALHKQVDALIEHDPGYVAKAEAQKAVVELSHAGRYLLLLALLLPAAHTARSPARLRRSELALFLPGLIIGALPAIVAVPFRDYELTLLATLGALGLLAFGSAAARAEDEWRAAKASAVGLAGRVRIALGAVSSEWPVRPTIRALLVAGAILAPAFLFARHLEDEHERWDRSVVNHPTVVLAAGATGSSAAHT